MNEVESKAWKHWSSNYKVVHSEMTSEQKEKRIEFYENNGWMNKDPKVLELLSDGFDKFKENMAKRIYADNPEVLDFNYCAKCNELARTPFAKQCRYCGHDWH